MKRMLILILALCMMMPAPLSIADAEHGHCVFLDMCVTGDDSFIFAAQDSILIMREGIITAQERCDDVEYIDYLNGTLYALCTRSDGVHIVVFGGDLLETARYELGWIGQVNGFAVSAGCAAVTATNMATYDDELYICDFSSGEVTRCDDVINPVMPAADADCIFLRCMDFMADALVEYDPADGSRNVIADHFGYGELIAVPGHKTCLNLKRDEIEYYCWKDGELEQRRYNLAGLGAMSALADADEENLYIYDAVSGRMQVYPLDMIAGMSNDTLTIGMFYDDLVPNYLEMGIGYFEKVHPDVAVEFKRYKDPDKMRLDLMSAQSDTDILFLDTMTCSNIVASGVFADLRDFSCIRALEGSDEFAKWPFHVMESPEGELLLLPAGSEELDIWTARTDEFARLGLDIPPEYWTWDDLLEIGRRAKAIDPNTFVLFSPHEILKQYGAEYVDFIGGQVNYDTPLFRHVLEIFKALHDEQLVLSAVPSLNTIDETDYTLLFDSIGFVSQQWELKEGAMYPPSLQRGDEPVVGLKTNLIGAYSASDDIELAAEFISLLYRAPIDKEAPFKSWDTEFPLIYTDTQVNMRANATEYGHCISKEHAQRLREFCSQSLPIAVFNNLEEVYGPAEEYAAGRISVDEAVCQIQRNMERLINE